MVLVLFLIFSIFTLKSPLADATVNLKYVTDYDLCQFVSKITTSNSYPEYFKEAKRRGLSCGDKNIASTQFAAASTITEKTAASMNSSQSSFGVLSWSCGRTFNWDWVNWRLDFEKRELRYEFQLRDGKVEMGKRT